MSKLEQGFFSWDLLLDFFFLSSVTPEGPNVKTNTSKMRLRHHSVIGFVFDKRADLPLLRQNSVAWFLHCCNTVTIPDIRLPETFSSSKVPPLNWRFSWGNLIALLLSTFNKLEFVLHIKEFRLEAVVKKSWSHKAGKPYWYFKHLCNITFISFMAMLMFQNSMFRCHAQPS